MWYFQKKYTEMLSLIGSCCFYHILCTVLSRAAVNLLHWSRFCRMCLCPASEVSHSFDEEVFRFTSLYVALSPSSLRLSAPDPHYSLRSLCKSVKKKKLIVPGPFLSELWLFLFIFFPNNARFSFEYVWCWSGQNSEFLKDSNWRNVHVV